MSKKNLHVLPAGDGQWMVVGSGQTKVYASKVEAVRDARSSTSSDKVSIRTAAGQMLRPARLKTSRSPDLMRRVVLDTLAEKQKSSK